MAACARHQTSLHKALSSFRVQLEDSCLPVTETCLNLSAWTIGMFVSSIPVDLAEIAHPGAYGFRLITPPSTIATATTRTTSNTTSWRLVAASSVSNALPASVSHAPQARHHLGTSQDRGQTGQS